jgi:hypothetical protein
LPRHINSAFPFKYCYVLLDFRHPCTASRFLLCFESVPHIFSMCSAATTVPARQTAKMLI